MSEEFTGTKPVSVAIPSEGEEFEPSFEDFNFSTAEPALEEPSFEDFDFGDAADTEEPSFEDFNFGGEPPVVKNPRDSFVDFLKKEDLFGSVTNAMGTGGDNDKIWWDKNGILNLPNLRKRTNSKLWEGLNALPDTLPNFLGDRMNDTALLSNPKEIRGLFNKFREEGGHSEWEISQMWSDVNAIYTPMDKEEDYRVLSDGVMLPNQNNHAWLDRDKATQLINASKANPESKARLLESVDELAALASNTMLRNYLYAADFNIHMENPMDYAERTGQMDEFGKPEFTIKYKRDVADKQGFVSGITNSAKGGALKVSMTVLGIAGLAGIESAGEAAGEQAKVAGFISQGSADAGLWGAIIEEAPSLVMQAALTRGAGRITTAAVNRSVLSGATKALGARGIAAQATKAAAGETLKKSIVPAVGNMAAVTMAGAQSAGASYAGYIAEGMSPTEAREKSLASGISTMLITGIFQVYGAGGVEKAMAGKSAAAVTIRDLFKNASVEKVTRGLAKLSRQTAKDVLGEGFEEGGDQLIQAFITSDPDTNMATAWGEAVEAMKVGMAIGGSIGGATAGVQKAAEIYGMNETAKELQSLPSITDLPVTPTQRQAKEAGTFNEGTKVEKGFDMPSQVVLKGSKKGRNVAIDLDVENQASHLEQMFGPPSEGNVYNEEFARPEDFKLREVKSNPNLEAVAYFDEAKRIEAVVDRVYNHETGKFEPMTPEIKAEMSVEGIEPANITNKFERRERIELPDDTPLDVENTPYQDDETSKEDNGIPEEKSKQVDQGKQAKTDQEGRKKEGSDVTSPPAQNKDGTPDLNKVAEDARAKAEVEYESTKKRVEASGGKLNSNGDIVLPDGRVFSYDLDSDELVEIENDEVVGRMKASEAGGLAPYVDFMKAREKTSHGSSPGVFETEQAKIAMDQWVKQLEIPTEKGLSIPIDREAWAAGKVKKGTTFNLIIKESSVEGGKRAIYVETNNADGTGGINDIILNDFNRGGIKPLAPISSKSNEPSEGSTPESVEAKVSPTNEETENFRLAHETEPEIVARTKPGEERTIAYAKRRAAAVELAKTIKKGDKITDPDGEVLIAERDANSKGEVLFEGAKEPINAATYLASSSASNASGERIQEKGSSIERAKSTTESKVSPTNDNSGSPKPISDSDTFRRKSSIDSKKLVFDTKDGAVYILYDPERVPEKNKNLHGASVAVKGHEKSNNDGFFLSKLEGRERSEAVEARNSDPNVSVRYGPSDVIYKATDYTGRSNIWSAAELTFEEPITSIVSPPSTTESNEQTEQDTRDPDTDSKVTTESQEGAGASSEASSSGGPGSTSNDGQADTTGRPEASGVDAAIDDEDASGGANEFGTAPSVSGLSEDQAFAGTRVHDQSEIGKIVKTQSENRIVDGKETPVTEYYVDSHETESTDGGANDDVTIGSMRMGQVLIGKGADGKIASMFRVVATQPMQNGAVRHILKQMKTESDLLKGSEIAGLSALYRPNPDFIKNTKAINNRIVELLATGQKVESDPKLLAEIEALTRHQFSLLTNKGFADSTLVFEASEDMMYASDEESAGNPKIYIDTARWAEYLSNLLSDLDVSNTIALDQLGHDFSETLAQTAYEEIFHYHTIIMFGKGTKDGDLLVSAMKDMEVLSNNNDILKTEFTKAANWSFNWAPPAVMTDDDYARVGHEMLASLMARTKTGRDPQSMREAMQRWVSTMSAGKAESKLNASLIRKMIELANRYFIAIRDFFKAHQTIEQLPSDLALMLKNVEKIMDEGGLVSGSSVDNTKELAELASQKASAQNAIVNINKTLEGAGEIDSEFDNERSELEDVKNDLKTINARIEALKADNRTPVTAPDTLNIRNAALSSVNEVLDHPAVFARDGMEYLTAMKELRQALGDIRIASGDEELMPISIDSDGKLIAPDTLAKDDKEHIDSILAELNTNARADLTQRAQVAANDLRRMLEWINNDPLFKLKDIKLSNGDTIEKLVTNSREIYRESLNTVVRASGKDASDFFSGINTALSEMGDRFDTAPVDLLGVEEQEAFTPITDYYLNEGSIGRHDKPGVTRSKALIEAERSNTEAQTAYDSTVAQTGDESSDLAKSAKKTLDASIKKLAKSTQALEDHLQKASKEKEPTVALEKAKSKLNGLTTPETIEKQKDIIRAIEASLPLTSVAQNIANLLGRRDQRRRQTVNRINRWRDGLGYVESIDDLVIKYRREPLMLRQAIEDAFPERSNQILQQVDQASRLIDAPARLSRFKDELNHMVMGGAQPMHMRNQHTWNETNAQISAGRLSDFSVFPQIMRDGITPVKSGGADNFLDSSKYPDVALFSGSVPSRPNFTYGASQAYSFSQKYDMMTRMADDVSSGAEASSALFGVNHLSPTYGVDGLKLDGSQKSQIMESNARFINERLITDLYHANIMGDVNIPQEATETMGFPVPRIKKNERAGSDGQYRYYTYPENIINIPDFKKMTFGLEYNEGIWNAIDTGVMNDVLAEIGEFVTKMTQHSDDYGKGVMVHQNGLTPAGLAYQAVAPKFVEFLALTKGITAVDPNNKSVRLENKFPALKEAYEALAPGFENSPAFVKTRSKVPFNAAGNIGSRFWELHKAAKVANQIYKQSMRAGRETYTVKERITEMSADMPINVDKMLNTNFVRNQLARHSHRSRVEGKESTFISLLTPIRASKGLDLYYSVSAELQAIELKSRKKTSFVKDEDGNTESLVESIGQEYATKQSDFEITDPLARTTEDIADFSESGESIITKSARDQKKQKDRLEVWRGEMLLALLGGNVDKVMRYVNSFGEVYTDALGNPQIQYNTTALDNAIVAELERLREEEVNRGVVLDGNKTPYDSSLKALAESHPEHKEMIDRVTTTDSLVQMSTPSDSPLLPQEAFDADTHTLFQHFASTIPNLAYVEGSVRWEASEGPDSIPTIAFVPDGNAPTIIMPYGGAVAVSPADASKALSDMILWMGKNGGANIQHQAHEILKQFETNSDLNTDLHEAVRANLEMRGYGGDLDREENVDAVLEAQATEWGRRIKRAQIAGLDERTEDGMLRSNGGSIIYNSLFGRGDTVLTDAQAAQVIVAALTDRSTQKALMLSMAENPAGQDPSEDELKSIGNIISPSLLPGFSEALREAYMADISNGYKIQARDGLAVEPGDEGFDVAASDAAKDLIDKAFDVNTSLDKQKEDETGEAAHSNPIVVGQSEWASKLLYNVVRGLEPKFTEESELINWLDDAIPSRAPRKEVTIQPGNVPSGLVPGVKPTRMSEMEARQVLSVMSDQHIAEITNKDNKADTLSDDDIQGSTTTKDLMLLNQELAELVRKEYKTVKRFDSAAGEDRAFNYGTYSYGLVLRSDGSRNDPYKGPRIAKGMINEGIRDGGKVTKDDFDNDVVQMKIDFEEIARLRAESGRTKQVHLLGDVEISDAQLDELSPDEKENVTTMTDLQYDINLYNAEVEEFKDGIRWLKRAALDGSARVESLKRAILEIDSLEGAMAKVRGPRTFMKIWEGSDHVDVSGSFDNAPNEIKAFFNGRRGLLNGMVNSIHSAYTFGIQDVEEFLTVPRGVRISRGASAAEPSLFREDPKDQVPASNDEIEAKINAMRLEIVASFKSERESLAAQIGLMESQQQDARVRRDEQIGQAEPVPASLERPAQFPTTEDTENLLQPFLDQLATIDGRESAALALLADRRVAFREARMIETALSASAFTVEYDRDESKAKNLARIAQRADVGRSNVESELAAISKGLLREIQSTNTVAVVDYLQTELADATSDTIISGDTEVNRSANQEAQDKAGLRKKSLDRHVRAHNARVDEAVRRVNRNLRGLIQTDPFKIELTQDSGIQVRAKMASFDKLLTGLSNPETLRFLIKAAKARDAVESSADADLAGLKSRDISMMDSDSRVRIPLSTRKELQEAMYSLPPNEVRQAMYKILSETIYPLQEAADAARVALKASLEKQINPDDVRGADLALRAFEAGSKIPDFQRLPEATRESIVLNIARDMMEGAKDRSESDVKRLIEDRVDMEVEYRRRRANVYAPRTNGVNRMNYLGTEDQIQILRRNHVKRGTVWSDTFMSLRKPGGYLNGMADAVDRMDQTDLIVAGAELMTANTGKKYDVVGDGIKLATANTVGAASESTAPKTNFSPEVDGKSAASADATIDLLEGGNLFKGGNANMTEYLGKFDIHTILRRDTFLRLTFLYEAVDQGIAKDFGVRDVVSADGTITKSESLHNRIKLALQDLDSTAKPRHLGKIQSLHNELMATVLADQSLKNIIEGFIPEHSLDLASATGLLNHDPMVRKYFAANLKGHDAVADAIGLIELGATGTMGREGYEFMQHGTSEVFHKKQKEILTGKNKFENAAEGWFASSVNSHLRSGKGDFAERADSLLRMLDQADQGIVSALSQGIKKNTFGYTPSEILLMPLAKIREIKTKIVAASSEDTYQKLEERLVYMQVRNRWKPFLTRMADRSVEFDLDSEMKTMKTGMTKQSRDWANFITESMDHIGSAITLQAKLEGLDASYYDARPRAPFRWQVFNREYRLVEEEGSMNEQLSVDRAMWKQNPTRLPKRGEIHMLDINGLTSPLQIFNDGLYRIAVKPAHSAFKMFAGESSTKGDKKFSLTAEGALIEMAKLYGNEDSINTARDATAVVAHLGQEIIRKDLHNDSPSNRAIDVANQMQQWGALKALISGKQIWAQVLPALAAYTTVRAGLKGNYSFLPFYAKIVFSATYGKTRNLRGKAPGASKLIDDLSKFALEFAPKAFKRASDGNIDLQKSVSRINISNKNTAEGRVTGKVGKLASPVTRVVSKASAGVTDFAGLMLHAVLAVPESTLVKGILAHEMLKSVNKDQALQNKPPISMEEFLDPDIRDGINITYKMRQDAIRMVNDMMAPTDRSMKGKSFQKSDTVVGEFIRGTFTTYANHQVHIGGNSHAARQMMKSKDKETKQEGRRLLASNIVQNTLFLLMRYEVMTAAAAYAMSGGDEEKEKKYKGWFYGLDESMNEAERKFTVMNWVALLAGGSGNPMGYRNGEWDKADLANDKKLASLRIAGEAVNQLAPWGVGVLASTALGSSVSKYALENTVMSAFEGDVVKYSRAGLTVPVTPVTDGGGTNSENWYERAIYKSGQFFANDISNLSAATSGVSSIVDPLIRMSNAREDINPLEAILMFSSEIPAMPRDMRTMVRGAGDKKLDVRVWDWD